MVSNIKYVKKKNFIHIKVVWSENWHSLTCLVRSPAVSNLFFLLKCAFFLFSADNILAKKSGILSVVPSLFQSIKKIKRADRKGSESVTEEKFAILFTADIAIAGCDAACSVQVRVWGPHSLLRHYVSLTGLCALLPLITIPKINHVQFCVE